jgi:hypothetical protein
MRFAETSILFLPRRPLFGLSLITAAIVHWNTVYLDRAVRQLRAQRTAVPDDLLGAARPEPRSVSAIR